MDYTARNDAANAQLASTRPVLAAALARLETARNFVRAHEAGIEMLRDAGDTAAIRSAQARLNGLRYKAGRAAHAVRQAGGIA